MEAKIIFQKKWTSFKNVYVEGDPNQNLKCLLAITLKLCISDPMLVKPKCVWKIVNKQLKIVNKKLKIKKIVRLSNAFWLFQHGVNMYSFRVIAKRHFKFWFGSPCRFYVFLFERFDSFLNFYYIFYSKNSRKTSF